MLVIQDVIIQDQGKIFSNKKKFTESSALITFRIDPHLKRCFSIQKLGINVRH